MALNKQKLRISHAEMSTVSDPDADADTSTAAVQIQMQIQIQLADTFAVIDRLAD